MTKRLPVTPAPGLLEEYAEYFDTSLTHRSQREGFRRYLEGLLSPKERNKTLTALANTEPLVGAQHPRAQSLQWFLSESTWDWKIINARRLELLQTDPVTAPDEGGVLVIDEHGDPKEGTKTAHVGRQYLANLGKVDNGVVSLTALWADERVYYPVVFEPYTPSDRFEDGGVDSSFRTKPEIALELVAATVEAGMPFRAVVADSLYGEDEEFKRGLTELGVDYVLGVNPSHSWQQRGNQVETLRQAAEGAGWKNADEPGEWVGVERTFRDGHTESWWALEIQAGPYGPEKAQRAVVITTDPKGLPDINTWYLLTSLPAPGTARATENNELAPADLAEVVRLYGLRMWVNQSYKEAKQSLGWSQYQVRSDLAIRRHWELVCCAFSFCWYKLTRSAGGGAPSQPEGDGAGEPATTGAERENGSTTTPSQSSTEREGTSEALDNAGTIMEGVFATAPARAARAA